MKKIIVGFSRNKKIFSKLIRMCTTSETSHTYIRIPVPEYNDNMIFQAAGLSVNYCNSTVFEEHHEVYEEYEIAISDELYNKNEKFRITEAGKPYSMRQIFGLLYVLFMRQIGFSARNPFSDGNHSYVCVEVVAEHLGLQNQESMTQEDMRRWCVKNGKLIRKLGLRVAPH